ncbi:unnamed protein product, partial [Polarella glacialis]
MAAMSEPKSQSWPPKSWLLICCLSSALVQSSESAVAEGGARLPTPEQLFRATGRIPRRFLGIDTEYEDLPFEPGNDSCWKAHDGRLRDT